MLRGLQLGLRSSEPGKEVFLPQCWDMVLGFEGINHEQGTAPHQESSSRWEGGLQSANARGGRHSLREDVPHWSGPRRICHP